MDVKLIVIGGKNEGKAIPVPGPKFLIGRQDDCQLRPGSDMVSRHHCVISLQEGLVTIRDLRSRNGTVVNGQKITDRVELKSGDRLKIGPLEFEIRLSVEVSGKKKPKVRSVEEAAARTVQSAAGDDMDVTAWLEDSDDTVADKNLRKTKPLPKVPAAHVPEPPIPAVEPLVDAEGKPIKYEPLFGRPVQKPTSENSRTAAAEGLKNILQRRP